MITLPTDLKIATANRIQLFDYRNDEDIINTKINLAKHTISFLRAGTKEVLGDGKAIRLDHQRFLVMKSGRCLMTERVSDTDRRYHSILLFFDDSSVVDFLEKHQSLSKRPENCPFYVFEYDDYIQHFVTSLAHLLTLPSSVQQRLLPTRFEEIMLYLTSKHGTTFLRALARQTDDRLMKLANVVENNKYNRLGLEELAFLCHMSVSTFKREFFT